MFESILSFWCHKKDIDTSSSLVAGRLLGLLAVSASKKLATFLICNHSTTREFVVSYIFLPATTYYSFTILHISQSSFIQPSSSRTERLQSSLEWIMLTVEIAFLLALVGVNQQEKRIWYISYQFLPESGSFFLLAGYSNTILVAD